MIYRLRVWHRLTGEPQYIGEMVCEINETGKARGAFRYAPDFFTRPDAFMLDPVSLDPALLHPGEDQFAAGPSGICNVFEDSLPDDWGRKLLIRRFKTPRADQNLPTLLRLIGSSGLGALSYSEHTKPDPSPPEKSAIYLSDLVKAAEAFERDDIDDPELNMLFGASSSPGGARPKALIFDESDGIHYLAKFPSIKDNVNVVRIEAATMSLAGKAGLIVPHTRLVECGSRDALLVQRFDLINGSPQRRHMISMRTLLKADGFYQSRYFELLKTVRKHSDEPAEDSDLLFRQMVFNAVIGNTDDHLKNFWMVYSYSEGWRLSPSFDLVPDIGRSGEHVLFFDDSVYYPGRQKLERIGRSWGVSNASAIIEQVFDAVSGWRSTYSDKGVSESDTNKFKEIDKHLVS